MRLLPDTRPRPRLLTSAVMSSPSTAEVTEKGKRNRTENRLMRFLGKVALVALIAAAVGFWTTRRDNIHDEAAAFRKLVSVGTRVLSTATHPTDPPDAIVVQLNADLVRVTTIALGHPRLAVINGKQVGEGDKITVHTPTRSVAITLRVLEISDRQVRLSDGSQVITAHLSKAEETFHHTEGK
jgi:hypothetical protein